MRTLAEDLREEQRQLTMRFDMAIARRRGWVSLEEALAMCRRAKLPDSSPLASHPQIVDTERHS